MARQVVIANGRLAHGKSAERWRSTVESLRTFFGNAVEIRYTTRRGEAIDLARNAVAEGAAWLIAAGGDGMAHEMVNGLYDCAGGLVTDVDVSFLPFGSGNDWARTLEIPMEQREAVERLARSTTRRVDLGIAVFRALGGGKGKRVFLNMAEAGLGAAMLARLAGRCATVGRGGYLLHAITEAIRYKPVATNLELDGETVEVRGPVLDLLVAGGRFFGGGIECAPMARSDDGMLEAVVIGDVGFIDILWHLRGFVRGRYFQHPKVSHRSVRRLRAWADEAVPLELDGEVVGTLPVEITVLPKALKVRC